MKISKLSLSAAILSLAATLFLAPAQIHADTYQIFNLGSTNGHDFVGIDNLGQVVILNLLSINPEYLTYNNGVLVNTTNTLPTLNYDNGTPCSPPSGFSVASPFAHVICNNGRTVFQGIDNPNGEPDGLYTGPISSPTLFEFSASTDARGLNSSGDFAWIDGQFENNYEAIDLTTRQLTPEPGSLLLVGTGFVSLFGVLRRKLS